MILNLSKQVAFRVTRSEEALDPQIRVTRSGEILDPQVRVMRSPKFKNEKSKMDHQIRVMRSEYGGKQGFQNPQVRMTQY